MDFWEFGTWGTLGSLWDSGDFGKFGKFGKFAMFGSLGSLGKMQVWNSRGVWEFSEGWVVGKSVIWKFGKLSRRCLGNFGFWQMRFFGKFEKLGAVTIFWNSESWELEC